MSSVPAAINTEPIIDFGVKSSCRNTAARISVIITLNLSIGTTLDTVPIWIAL